MKVRIKSNCTVFHNTIRYEFTEGWNEVENEAVLKRLYAQGMIASSTPQVDEVETKNVGNPSLLERKRRGRPAVLHATL